jgi:predicted ATPase
MCAIIFLNMEPTVQHYLDLSGPWDEEHVKALLHFPRFPVRIIQQEPWQTWIGEHGGMKAVLDYLQEYPFTPSHRRMLDVILASPESIAEVYADRLNISRATYFYQLREMITAVFQALNHWCLPESVLHASAVIPLPKQNLPAPLTSLIGVDAAISSLTRLMLRKEVRLLSLLGPGGIGKTRLSIEVARNIGLDCAFVDLSAVNHAPQLLTAISQTLGIRASTLLAIQNTLRAREFLLILDNFEQLYPARETILELLSSLPQLKIIVTSRIALNLNGEHEFMVPPLAVTNVETVKDQQLWGKSPAVLLFVQRAQAICPTFSLNNDNVEEITELCQRLEGLPLAIELAAYQIKYLSPKAMLTRIQNSRLAFFDLNVKKMPSQQQSMRSVYDWSYRLLPHGVQHLFCQLAEIPGDFSLEEAKPFCSSRNLENDLNLLVDHSFLEQHADHNGEPRFQMSGMTREYASERCQCLQTS